MSVGEMESPLSVSLFRWESPGFLCASLSTWKCTWNHSYRVPEELWMLISLWEPPHPSLREIHQPGWVWFGTSNPTLCSAPGQPGSTHSFSWNPQTLRNLQHLLNGQIKTRKMCLFHLFNMVLIMTTTPNLCGMAGSLHNELQHCCFCRTVFTKPRLSWILG